MSRMLADCAEAGTSASVVVAFDPETIASFAYGDVVAPMPTTSVEVARVIIPVLLVVHPPPVDAPVIVIAPQDTLPEPSV